MPDKQTNTMKRQFSSQLLFQLRNDIPVDHLIQKGLRIPTKHLQGRFRFQCPACQQFDTATNPKTNLARCFSCQRNFNNIDLVILVRSVSFVDAVKRLTAYHNRFFQKKTAQHS